MSGPATASCVAARSPPPRRSHIGPCSPPKLSKSLRCPADRVEVHALDHREICGHRRATAGGAGHDAKPQFADTAVVDSERTARARVFFVPVDLASYWSCARRSGRARARATGATFSATFVSLSRDGRDGGPSVTAGRALWARGLRPSTWWRRDERESGMYLLSVG